MWVPTPYQLVSIISSIFVIGLISYMLHQLLKPQVNDDDDDDYDNQEQESHNAIIRKRKRFNPFNMSNWSRHKTLRFFTLAFAAFSYISHLINVIINYKQKYDTQYMTKDDAWANWNSLNVFPSTIFSLLYTLSFNSGEFIIITL